MNGKDGRSGPEPLDAAALEGATGGTGLEPLSDAGVGLGTFGSVVTGAGVLDIVPGGNPGFEKTEGEQTVDSPACDDPNQMVQVYRDLIDEVIDKLRDLHDANGNGV